MKDRKLREYLGVDLDKPEVFVSTWRVDQGVKHGDDYTNMGLITQFVKAIKRLESEVEKIKGGNT